MVFLPSLASAVPAVAPALRQRNAEQVGVDHVENDLSTVVRVPASPSSVELARLITMGTGIADGAHAPPSGFHARAGAGAATRASARRSELRANREVGIAVPRSARVRRQAAADVGFQRVDGEL